MKTSADWIREIEDLFEGQKSSKIRPPQAVEMNNTIGKLIAMTKLQLEYNRQKEKMAGKAIIIPMLEGQGLLDKPKK